MLCDWDTQMHKIWALKENGSIARHLILVGPLFLKHFAPNFWNKPGINCQKSNIVNRWEIHRIIDSDNELLSLTSSSSSSQSSSNLLILVSYWKNIIFSQVVSCWESCSIRNSFLNSENGTNKGHEGSSNWEIEMVLLWNSIFPVPHEEFKTEE